LHPLGVGEGWVITVTMRLLAAEGKAAELAGLLEELCAVPGCLRNEVSRSAHDERRFLVLMAFEDEAAQAAHSNSEGYTRALPSVMECLEGLPDIEIYEEL